MERGGPRRAGTAEILSQFRNANFGLRNEATESREPRTGERRGRGVGGKRGDGETERRRPRAESRSQFRRPNVERRTSTDERGRARVVGEVVATKPAWKHRRASENDEELLQLLADGFGKWIAERMGP